MSCIQSTSTSPYGAYAPMSRAHPVQARGHRVLRRVLDWMDRSRQRRALAELDPRLLADIGVSPQEAMREAAKAFWRK